MWGRKNTIRLGHTAVLKAGNYAFAHRRDKKGVFRKLWNVRINAAVRELGMSYSKFIFGLKTAKVEIDRKVLSEIAMENPVVFAAIVEKSKKRFMASIAPPRSSVSSRSARGYTLQNSVI